MGLSELFRDSFSDYGKSWKIFLKLGVWLLLIGAIPFFLGAAGIETYSHFVMGDDFGDFMQSGSLTGNAVITTFAVAGENFPGSTAFVLIPLVLVTLFFLFMYLFFIVLFFSSVTYVAIYNKNGKMSVRDALRGGLRFFWRYLGWFLLIVLIVIGLFIPGGVLLLITILTWGGLTLGLKVLLVILTILVFLACFILMIYLMVRWSFSSYIFVGENSGVIEAMRRSVRLVRGHWWMVFAFMFLLSIISSSVSFLISIASFLSSILFELMKSGATYLGAGWYFIVAALSSIFDQILTATVWVTVSVFTLLFFKNLYLELKNKPIKR